MRPVYGKIRSWAARIHVVGTYASVVTAFRTLPRRVLVLRYHALGLPEAVAAYASAGISVTPERFAEHVAFLARRYDVIDLDEACARVRGETKAGRPGVVITFDDGYRDNFDHALPVLKRHGATATFYVVAGSIWPEAPIWTVRLRHMLSDAARPKRPGPVPFELDLAGLEGRQRSARALTRWLRGVEAGERERRMAGLSEWLDRSQVLDTRVMMDANELTGMVAGGSTVGAHTLTHPLLTEVGEAEARRELIDGKVRLESLLGRPVRHLSYPNPGSGPQHDASVRAIAREAGYATATTSTGGLLSAGSDPLAISRFGVTPGHQERLLFRLLGEG